MKKVFVLSISIGTFIFAEKDFSDISPLSNLNSFATSYSWVQDTTIDDVPEAGRRRGKGQRGRRRGGSGLR